MIFVFQKEVSIEFRKLPKTFYLDQEQPFQNTAIEERTTNPRTVLRFTIVNSFPEVINT